MGWPWGAKNCARLSAIRPVGKRWDGSSVVTGAEPPDSEAGLVHSTSLSSGWPAGGLYLPKRVLSGGVRLKVE